MPGSVAAVSVSGVLPQSLFSSFQEIREPEPLRVSEYHDGSSQRSKLATTSRKRFRLTERLTPADLATLKTFYDSKGMTAAFFFYNPMEPFSGQQIGSNYDATGASSTGRYSVRFANSWNQSVGMALCQVDIEVVEVA